MVRRSQEEQRAATVGMVVGLTNADDELLKRIPDAPLLIPGLGAQGGDLSSLAEGNRKAPSLINVSRGILYQDPELSYQEKAKRFAAQIRQALSK